MADVKLKALRNHPFGVGIRETGEVYFASGSEASTLVALGWAEKVADKAVKAKDDEPKAKGYKTRDLKAGK